MGSIRSARFRLPLAYGVVAALVAFMPAASDKQQSTVRHAAASSPSAAKSASLAKPPRKTPPGRPLALPRGKGAPPNAPGLAPVFYAIPTTDKVAFITIDDGMVRLPQDLPELTKLHVPVTLFLISSVARRDPAYFRAFQDSGAVIEAHTITHTSLRGRSYARQKHEICGSSDDLGADFGKRPTLFRPPYGNFDIVTRQAAHDCGMKAVLHWRATVDKGRVFYQSPTKKLHAGDIVLMHFRPAFVADIDAAVNAIRSAGLEPALLEDYIG